MKKIKNPELYIKRLKAQNARLESWWQQAERVATQRVGRVIVNWEPHEEKQAALSFALLALRPGDKIVIHGEVKEVHGSIDSSCGNPSSNIIYYVRETRKLD